MSRRPPLQPTYLVVFVVGLVAGLALMAVLHRPQTASATSQTDAQQAGLPTAWIAFGFLGQALFTGRMLLQWITAERKKRSVVPIGFWWLSLCGGLVLAVYFLRRGDPVGSVGQLAPLIVYSRNLILIYRHKEQATEEPKAAESA